MHYVPSPLIGAEGGASFPCGHCTVGFLFGVGWWIFRPRRPRWAVASLAAGLAAGTLLGVGRMAAGAHFFSDVIWSALLAYGVAHVLYFHVLRLEPSRTPVQRPTGVNPSRWPGALGIAAPLAGVVVLLALYALPHGSDLSASVALSGDSPRILEVEADRANITLDLVDGPTSRISAEGELHGFGMPGARLGARFETIVEAAPTLRYSIEERGLFTDVDGFVRLTVPATAFERIRVRVGRGDIQVLDTTRTGVVGTRALPLELHTAGGTVRVLRERAR